MKRKRKKAARVPKEPSHDPRTLATPAKAGGPLGFMPGRHGTERVTITDPDGYWRSMRRAVDTIDVMYRRRQIDDRQLEAATVYRRTEEALRGSMPCTLDLTRARGGGIANPSQVLLIASETMEAAQTLLGRFDSRIVSAIVTDGHTIISAARMLYPSNTKGKQAKWVAEHVGRRFREALTILADAWIPRRVARIDGERMFDPDDMAVADGVIEPGGVVHSDRLGNGPPPAGNGKKQG